MGNFYPRPPGGGRPCIYLLIPINRNFYPRPPGGGRHVQSAFHVMNFQFLSTPSGWRATGSAMDLRKLCADFYPRPPGGGRRASTALRTHFLISIHALRVEGDLKNTARPLPSNISIHALRVEGDPLWMMTLGFYKNFYPRPPGGGRLLLRLDMRGDNRFLSTPSGWRATIERRILFDRKQDFYPRPPGGGRHFRLFAVYIF